jgi:uncharacterized protein (TIGR02246 family)
MTQEALQAAIVDINQRWNEAFNRGDVAALVALYDEQGAVLPAGGNAALGAAQIKALFAGAIDQGLHDHRIELHAVIGDREVATQRGRWSAQANGEGGLQRFSGHLTVVYRRQPDGSWRVLTHIWN